MRGPRAPICPGAHQGKPFPVNISAEESLPCHAMRRAPPRAAARPQRPLAADEDEDAGATKRARGPGSAVVGRWQEMPVRSSSMGSLRAGAAAAGGAAPAAPRRPREAGVVEAEQFMKYFHLVPAAVRPRGCSSHERWPLTGEPGNSCHLRVPTPNLRCATSSMPLVCIDTLESARARAEGIMRKHWAPEIVKHSSGTCLAEAFDDVRMIIKYDHCR